MAQAAEITLAYASRQVQASFMTLKLPMAQKIFLGKDFSHVNVHGRIPYTELMETLQGCIHKAQDKEEKGCKSLAEKTIDQLNAIARAHKLGQSENIELITKVALEALKPNQIFGKAKVKSNPTIDKGTLEKVLSLLVIGHELVLIQDQATEVDQKIKTAKKTRSQLAVVTDVVVDGKKKMFFEFPPNLSADGLAFSLRWVRMMKDEKGLLIPGLQMTSDDLDELETYTKVHDQDIQKVARNLMTILECSKTISTADYSLKAPVEIMTEVRKQTDISADYNQIFLRSHHRVYKECCEINTLEPDPKKATVPSRDSLMKVSADLPEFFPTYQFMYKYFFREYVHLLKPGNPREILSKYSSLLHSTPFILPAPENLEAFFNDKKTVKRPAEEKKEDGPAAKPVSKSKKKQRSKEENRVDVAPPKPAPAAPAIPKPRDKIAEILAEKVFPVKEIVYSDRVLAAIQDQAAFSVDGDGRHRFFLQLDQFLGTVYSQKREWINTTGHRDTLYVMPGELEVSKGEWKRCQFEWCIGADGKCYHRFCSFKEKNILIESWMSGTALTDENFPTLQQSHKDATWKEKPHEKRVENITISVHPRWNYIIFTDAKTNISCRIFRIGKD